MAPDKCIEELLHERATVGDFGLSNGVLVLDMNDAMADINRITEMKQSQLPVVLNLAAEVNARTRRHKKSKQQSSMVMANPTRSVEKGRMCPDFDIWVRLGARILKEANLLARMSMLIQVATVLHNALNQHTTSLDGRASRIVGNLLATQSVATKKKWRTERKLLDTRRP